MKIGRTISIAIVAPALKVSLVLVMVLLCLSVQIETAISWPSPTDQSLCNVWCSGYGWWGVGIYGTIIWWNPDSSVNDWELWTPSLPSPTSGSTLYSTFMRAQNDGWIVGSPPYYGQPPTILHWTGYPPGGGGWNTVTAPSTGSQPLMDVWAVSANNAWAVGGMGVILHWNGVSWSTASSPTAKTLWSIHMVSSTNGWAVGGDIIHWNGASWSIWPNPTSELLMSVYMVDANNGWATGADGTILHWNGASWQTVQSPTTQNLYGVTMTTADSGWAVGGNASPSGDGTVIRWDGTRWRPCTIQTTEWTLRSVDMVSDAIGGWAVGDHGTMIRLDTGGYYGEVAIQYELTVASSVGSGTTNPAPGNYWHDDDTDVSVDAQPASGWMLDHWVLDGANVGSDDPYTVTMDADHTLTAVFTEIQHQLTISVTGSGTTNPSAGSHTYSEGTDVSVDAQPASGWQLDHWELDGSNVGTTDPYTVAMDADHSLTAVFTEVPPEEFDLTIAVTGSGSTSPSVGVHTYTEGTEVSVDAQPDSGWMLDHWLLDGADVGSDDPFPVAMDDDHSLTAVFTEVTQDPPVASFTYSPPNPLVNDTITFDTSGCSDADGTIVSYSWDFGDGETSTSQNPTHAYDQEGSYTVTLTVTDDDGLTDTATKTISDVVIPEFPTWTILPIFAIATLAVMIYRKKLTRKSRS